VFVFVSGWRLCWRADLVPGMLPLLGVQCPGR
jgi:hypothetical protein